MEIYKNLDLNDLDGEIWKIIKDFPDYAVSDMGRVKSFVKWHGTDVRILEPSKDKDGYLCVGLSKNGEKPKTKRIHRLLYQTFRGEIPEGYVVHHRDSIKKNNILDNLQMMTRTKHQKLHNPIGCNSGKLNPNYDKSLYGEDNHFYKKHHSEETKNLLRKKFEIFSNEEISNIRKLYDNGLYLREIAKLYKCSIVTISRIKNNQRYKNDKY